MALIIERKSIERMDNIMIMMDASLCGPHPDSNDFHAVEQTLKECFIHSEKLKVLLEDADEQVQHASVSYDRLRVQYLHSAGFCLSQYAETGVSEDVSYN